MRPKNDQARESLQRELRRRARSTGDLIEALGVSGPSVHRMLRELAAEGALVSAGRTRQRMHALRRPVRGETATLALYTVDEQGLAKVAGTLAPVFPQGCLATLDGGWPQAGERWWDGLPYPLYDMRPQGYLGRLLARALSATLRVPENPEEWSDDDVLSYLAQYGDDTSGNLIVGEQALQRWSRERTRGALAAIPSRQCGARYVQLAEASVSQGVAGSSAGGEFPKFTAARELAGARTPHVIVKFSGADDSAAVRRWSDLLVCEHLALQALDAAGRIAVARSRVLQHGGRTFLESERFDRHGDFGRSAVVTLGVADAALVGSGGAQWPRMLRAGAAQHLFSPEAVEAAEELHWFGRFIANTDMHPANLGLRPAGDVFVLAPAYDMLPMLYAPLRAGEVPLANFDPSALPAPPPGRERAWRAALDAALSFWAAAAGDARITPAFRSICAANADALQSWAGTWGVFRN